MQWIFSVHSLSDPWEWHFIQVLWDRRVARSRLRKDSIQKSRKDCKEVWNGNENPDIYECLWMSMNVYGCLWMSTAKSTNSFEEVHDLWLWQISLPHVMCHIVPQCKALDMNGVPWAKPKWGYIGEIFSQSGSQGAISKLTFEISRNWILKMCPTSFWPLFVLFYICRMQRILFPQFSAVLWGPRSCPWRRT